MRITFRRVKDNLLASMIEGPNGENISAGQLPTNLSELCLRLLTGLIGTETILIYDRPEQTLFKQTNGYVTFDALEITADTAFRERVLEVTSLLQWHFSPRWAQENPDDNTLLICAYCQKSRTRDRRDFCSDPLCSSHDKLTAIIGPDYRRQAFLP